MKKISYWAKDHKWMTRFIIVACYLLLNILGILAGTLMNDISIILSPTILFVFAAIFLAGAIVYPSIMQKGKSIRPSVFYIRQKSCDFILIASTFLMIVYTGNHWKNSPAGYSFINAATPVSKDSSIKNYKTIGQFSSSLKDENGKSLKWKERKKLLKQQVKAIKKAKDLSNAEKTLLLILSMLVATNTHQQCCRFIY